MNNKAKKKKGNSFIVEIKSNEGSTWQGRVTWVDEQRSQSFRSALELIKLMDSAMAGPEPAFAGASESQEQEV